MSGIGKHLNAMATPQREPIPWQEARQVENNAGGFVYALDDWARLDRFLIIGSDGGTYYVRERKLTLDNAAVVKRCLGVDPVRTVKTIADVSHSGRAPKNDPAVLALVIAATSSDPKARAAAYEALPVVCRIPTHLFQFIGWHDGIIRVGSRRFRTAVAKWYNGKPADGLAYHLLKYQQRDGWSHRDVLRLAHPKAATQAHEALYRYAIAGHGGLGSRIVKVRTNGSETVREHEAVNRELLPAIVEGFEKAKAATAAEMPGLVRQYRLTHEMVPSGTLSEPEIWRALIDAGMPMHALVRNLGRMTANGLLKPLSDAVLEVTNRLADKDAIRKSRLHPLAVLVALKTYAQGRGDKGSLSWKPVQAIVDALDAAFYLAFDNVEPTGKKLLLALDVSGSMGSANIAGTPLTAREASAAMAMVTARREQNHLIVAFTAGGIHSRPSRWRATHSIGCALTHVDISPRERLDDVVKKTAALPMGGTDCALPFIAAEAEKWEVDGFVTYTDNETWAGAIHPSQALRSYREKLGRPARSVVVGMTATEFTIADPADAGSLDVVGFDAATPSVIADFIGNAVQPCAK